MKVIPIALQAAYAADAMTIATCLKLTRLDSVVAGWTDSDRALTVSGVTYAPGFGISALVSSSSMSVDNMELTFLADELDRDDVMANRWVGAAVEVFEVNRAAVSDGVNMLKQGTTGEVRIQQGEYVMEVRGLLQAFQQTQGIVTSKTCRVRFGSTACGLDVADFTEIGALTAVASRTVMTDSSRAEAAGTFTEGVITFLTGDNEGVSQKVKAFASGVITLSLPLPFDPQVGDTYSIVVGCARTRAACIAFDNILNFQGEPDLPGQDELTKTPSSSDQPAAEPALP